jgi:hypothetical protein
MRKFLKIEKFFQKICKKFQPLMPRTKKFPAAAAENKKFPAAAVDREKKIEIFQPPPRKTSAYTSIYESSNAFSLIVIKR